MINLEKLSFCLLFPIVYFILNSCVIPVYIPPYSGERIIDISDIQSGKTTKEDVLLRFGNVFRISPDERIFTGKYSLDKGYAGLELVAPVGTPRTLWEKSIQNEFEVEIEFDDNDVVKRCEQFNLPRNISYDNLPKSSIQNWQGDPEN